MATTICPVCGCTSFHYSSTRLMTICDQCRTPLIDDATRQRNESYDRALATAKQHARVGNWAECKRLISPFCNDRPQNTEMYLLLLAATTKGYTDYLLDNTAETKEAATYWDRLAAIGVVNAAMRRYADMRKMKYKNSVFWAYFTLVMLSLSGGGLMFCAVTQGNFLHVVGAFIGVCLLIGFAENAGKHIKNHKVKIHCTSQSNPFRN